MNKNETIENLVQLRCIPCEGGIPPFTEEEENFYLARCPGWIIDRSKIHTISRRYHLKDFKQALAFVNAVGELAEAEMEMLYPTISMPCSIALFDLGEPIISNGTEEGGD